MTSSGECAQDQTNIGKQIMWFYSEKIHVRRQVCFIVAMLSGDFCLCGCPLFISQYQLRFQLVFEILKSVYQLGCSWWWWWCKGRHHIEKCFFELDLLTIGVLLFIVFLQLVFIFM